MTKLTNKIQNIISQHQKMTPKVQKDMGHLGFTYKKVGKYLGIRSKDLFIVKVDAKYYVGVGMAATKYKYYEENFGMVKEVKEEVFNTLKKENSVYLDYTGMKNIWL